MTTFAPLESNRIFTVQKNYTDVTTPDLTFQLDALPTATAYFVLHFYREGQESTTSEWMFITSVNAGTNEVTCDNAAKRGLQFDDTLCNLTTMLANTAGIAANRKPIYSGYKAEIVAFHANLNDKASKSGDNVHIAGKTSFTSTTEGQFVFQVVTTAQKNALTGVANGMVVYDSDLGQFQYREGGAWVSNTTGGSVPDASTTVAGKVEQATAAETIAGGATGGTSAKIFATPADIAAVIQNANWVYAADAGATDDYAITITPAPTAYADGQVFIFKAATANTGACTLNVNALGAKALKTNDGSDPGTNYIVANSRVLVQYDGTNFVILSAGSRAGEANTFFDNTDITGAEAQTLTAGATGDAGTLHKHLEKSLVNTINVAATSDTENIAHGLGRIPNFLEIIATTIGGQRLQTSGFAQSWGCYDGTNTMCVFNGTSSEAKEDTAGVDTAKIIKLYFNESDAGASKLITATVVLTATEIQLTFANSDDKAVDIYTLCKVR